MKNVIRIEHVLEYIDVPQLFLGRDGFDTQYLCLLYDDEPSCRYTAIRISTARYSQFLRKEVDLRSLFVAPEYEGEYFDVVFDGSQHVLEPLQEHALTEERLPGEGFFYDNADREILTVSVPKTERGFFDLLVRRHGWVAM